LDLAELEVFDQSGLAIFLGPNGAGKSSLINAATGYVPIQAPGKVIFENGVRYELSRLSRDRIVRSGIARTFQTPALFPSLTVEESLQLAAILGKPTGQSRRFISLFRQPKSHGSAVVLAGHLIEELGLQAVRQARMDELSFPMLRRVELGRALASQPRLLLLDEPSAGADGSETKLLVGLITHKLPEMIRLLFEKGLYRYPTLAIGLVTHDRVLLEGIAAGCCQEPVAHCFERGQLKTTCRLRHWLNSTKAP
jgi:branched-chain amino acid transport system ATP-binding protein